MEQVGVQPRCYTVEEYMALEQESEVRYEFFEGEVFARARGNIRHNLLVGNCAFHFHRTLKGRLGSVFTESVQLAVAPERYYNHPDVMVTCSADDVAAEYTVHSPLLLIEVLSEATEVRDRSWKYGLYTAMPSLQHYLLVSQSYWLIEWHRREASGIWSFTPLFRLTDEIHFPELDMKLRLADIYEDTGVAEMSIYPESEED